MVCIEAEVIEMTNISLLPLRDVIPRPGSGGSAGCGAETPPMRITVLEPCRSDGRQGDPDSESVNFKLYEFYFDNNNFIYILKASAPFAYVRASVTPRQQIKKKKGKKEVFLMKKISSLWNGLTNDIRLMENILLRNIFLKKLNNLK